jgi:ABC-2 type transport system permease protein
MMVSEFSAYYHNPEMAQILDAMPQKMLEALSMAGANLTTVIGFISMASVYFYLLLGIYSGLLGSSIISKEERDKTVEFFLTLPISRARVIWSKLAAAVLLSLSLNLVIAITLYSTTMKYDQGENFNKFLFLMMLGIFIIQMIFMTVGMLLAATLKRYKLSGMISMSIIFGAYVLSIITALSKNLENLKYFTPFKFFEAGTLSRELAFEPVYVIISIGIILVSVIGTFVIYPKRDVHI